MSNPGNVSRTAFSSILRNIKRLSPQSFYLPRDLNDKWNSTQKRVRTKDTSQDQIKSFDVDWKKEYRNISLLNRYVNPLGQIKKREATGLSMINQKKVLLLSICNACALQRF